MPNPSSITTSLSFEGMDIHEAQALLAAMPGGARWDGAARQPMQGGLRFDVKVSNLNVSGAEALTRALASHTRIAEEGQ